MCEIVCCCIYQHCLGVWRTKKVVVVNIKMTARLSSLLAVWPTLPPWWEAALVKASLLSSAV